MHRWLHSTHLHRMGGWVQGLGEGEVWTESKYGSCASSPLEWDSTLTGLIFSFVWITVFRLWGEGVVLLGGRWRERVVTNTPKGRATCRIPVRDRRYQRMFRQQYKRYYLRLLICWRRKCLLQMKRNECLHGRHTLLMEMKWKVNVILTSFFNVFLISGHKLFLMQFLFHSLLSFTKFTGWHAERMVNVLI